MIQSFWCRQVLRLSEWEGVGGSASPLQEVQALPCLLHQGGGVKWPAEVVSEVRPQELSATHELHGCIIDEDSSLARCESSKVHNDLSHDQVLHSTPVQLMLHFLRAGHLLSRMKPTTIVSSADFRMWLV